jgi:hypothetical protein
MGKEEARRKVEVDVNASVDRGGNANASVVAVRRLPCFGICFGRFCRLMMVIGVGHVD